MSLTMMTKDDIKSELGWTDSMIHSLLQAPDSNTIRRCKTTGGYARGHYYRERVLAVAQSTEGQAAKRRWDETLRGFKPNPDWTTHLGDIGRQLGITAVAAGRMLELLGYRSDKHVTDRAVAAGCGVRRWDGYTMHDDWHLDRVVAAIRSAAEATGEPDVGDALAAAVARQEGRKRKVVCKREQDAAEAARQQEEDAVVSGLRVELRALRANDPGLTLLNAVEFITPDPVHRIGLYRRCSGEELSFLSSGMGDDPTHLKLAPSAAKDLALLERRAMAEGFQV
jgi:hypothetical protein